MITNITWELVRSKRLWIWFAMYLMAGCSLRALPVETWKRICDLYTTRFKEKLDAEISQYFAIARGADCDVEIDQREYQADNAMRICAPVSNVSAIDTYTDAEEIQGILDGFFCPPKVNTTRLLATTQIVGYAPDRFFRELPQILLGALVLSVITTLVIPQPRRTVVKPVAERIVVAAAVGNPNQLLGNSRLRVGIAYAFASCVATVLQPPSFEIGTSGIEPQLPHLLSLTIAAILAATWIAMKLYRVPVAVVEIACHVAFAGVFIAGLIALLVAMPYRIMTTIVEAKVSFDQVKLFAAVRLLALPTIAALFAAASIAGIRKWFRKPVFFWPVDQG